MEQLTGSKLGKEYIKVRVHNVKCQAGWVTGWNQGCKRIINNLRCAGDTTLMVENEEELKCLLMKVKEESEKADLKLNMKKIKIMACSPITLWEIEGGKVEAMADFPFLGSKITADCDCHEIRCLLFGRKAVANLDSILKSKDITLLTKVHIIKATVFPIVMYHVWMWELDCKEGWAPKKWSFWIVVLGTTLESPWSARRSSQAILKETNLEYSLEGLMLKPQYFSHLVQRTDSLKKIMMLRKTEGKRGRGWQRMRWLDDITNTVDMNLSKRWEIVEDWHAAIRGITGLDRT